jgi:hypothetical protein
MHRVANEDLPSMQANQHLAKLPQIIQRSRQPSTSRLIAVGPNQWQRMRYVESAHS